MSDETVFFGPYGRAELATVVGPTLDQAFRDGALPSEVREHGLREAARRWGDARKTLRLFRRAGETATERGLGAVTVACLEANLDATDKEAITEKLLSLPFNHVAVLVAVTGWTADGEIVQPVTTAKINELLAHGAVADRLDIDDRTVRSLLTDLETMGLVETWVDSRGHEGRVKQVETTFDPQWVRDAEVTYVERLVDE
jgi:Cdc6-like AAA superfamily ATPase